MAVKSSIAVAELDVSAFLLKGLKRCEVMFSKKFPKSARLLCNAQYKHLNKRGLRLFGEQIAINVRQGNSFQPRLGITVSRKYGKAHDRNRFKRIVREAFRELRPHLPQDLEMNVSPRANGLELSTQAILVEIQRLISQLTLSSQALKTE